MPSLHHHPPLTLLQNAAVTALQASPEMGRVSRRLLTDLVEHAGVVHVTAGEPLRAAPFLLIVLQSPVAVTPVAAESVSAPDGPAPAAPATDGSGPGPAPIVLRPGVHWADEPRLESLAGQMLELRARPHHSAHVVVVEEPMLRALLRASPALAVDAFCRHFTTPDLGGVRTELIWMALAPDLRVPLEALTQLLAAAVGAQFAPLASSPEPAGVVTLVPGRVTLAVWRDGAFDAVPLQGATSVAAIAARFRVYTDRCWPERRAIERLFFVSPESALTAPAAFAGERFHRVLYMTDRELAGIPYGLERLLQTSLHVSEGAAQSAGTVLSSFVPCRLLPPRTPVAGCSWLASVGRALPWHGAGKFRSLPLDATSPGASPSVRSRLRTDECRLSFDLEQLTREWQRWLRGSIGASSFPAHVFADDSGDGTSACRETAYRWARAVTNRSVGVALSGGGACAYRVLPLIEMLRRRGVPIDYFAGVSGGALIGAYYCAEGLAGLRHARQRGPAFFLASLAAGLWSGVMELLVDRDLRDTRVEDLEVVFLPVTTALGDPPAASVVVAGTLGEAVRASGSALFSFGPTRKGAVRYADGATATMIPAKVLSDYGADLVLACNCVPGPRYGNPFGGHMLGRIAYATPIVGRIIDTWVASSYLLTTASRMAGTDAQVYWEPSPTQDPLLEAPHFECANEIVAQSLETDGAAMREVTERMHRLWMGLCR